MNEARFRGVRSLEYVSAPPGGLKLIGYWMEDLRQNLCLPQELVGELPTGVRERLIQYLRAGTSVWRFRGWSWCRFFCDCDRGVMGSGELTDGEWIWPEGLVHYVETHGIILPEDFIKHVLEQDAPPSNPPYKIVGLKGEPLIASDYWITWCAQHRSAPWLERIEKARVHCDKVASCAIRSSVDSRIAKFGLADYECGISGCGEKARNGLKYCGEHCLLDSEWEEITIDCYPVSAVIFPRDMVNPSGVSESGWLPDDDARDDCSTIHHGDADGR